MLPLLLEQLDDCNNPQQKLASLFVILGHLIVHAESQEGRPDDVLNDPDTVAAILHALFPHLSCAGGLPRSIAQLLVHSLVGRFCKLVKLPLFTDITKTEDEAENALLAAHTEQIQARFVHHFSLRTLRQVHRHLHLNKDTVKLMDKQRAFFRAFRLGKGDSNGGGGGGLGTVAGLQRLGFDAGGEAVPEHLINILTDFVRANADAEAAAARAELSTLPAVTATLDETDDTSSSALALQTKIIPFDELQLSVNDYLLSRFACSAYFDAGYILTASAQGSKCCWSTQTRTDCMCFLD